MKRFFTGFGLGIVGIALALGLTLGALAVAGPSIGGPPTPPRIDSSMQEPSPSATRSPADAQGGHDKNDGKDDGRVSPSRSPASTPSTSSGDNSSSTDDSSTSGDSTSGTSDSSSGSPDGEDDSSSGDHEGGDD